MEILAAFIQILVEQPRKFVQSDHYVCMDRHSSKVKCERDDFPDSKQKLRLRFFVKVGISIKKQLIESAYGAESGTAVMLWIRKFHFSMPASIQIQVRYNNVRLDFFC